jgi:hypothetical protein
MASARRSGVVFFCFLAVLFASACQKESVAPSPAQLLRGRWELDHSTNGMTGRLEPADHTRHQEIIFAANGQAQFLLNGAVTSTKPYTLTQAKSYLSGKTETFITFGPGTYADSISPYLANLSASAFTLVIDAADGPSATYVRRSPPGFFYQAGTSASGARRCGILLPFSFLLHISPPAAATTAAPHSSRKISGQCLVPAEDFAVDWSSKASTHL